MTIPSHEELELPLLKFAADGKDHSLNEAAEFLAEEYKLTAEERTRLIPSGGQTILINRVSWTNTYLKKAKLLEKCKLGYFKITARGRVVLQQVAEQGLSELSNKFLQQFPEFVAFYRPKRTRKKISNNEIETKYEEVIENAYQQIQQNLSTQLLEAIKKCTPNYFEALTVKLLVAMGYGGKIKNAGKVTAKTNDQGIDGIIEEDKLGLRRVYIQAKKWVGTVGRPEIQKFAGALEGARAEDQGVFITTSDFSQGAKEYIEKIGKKIVLINGEMLAGLMIENNIGVTPTVAYEFKCLDMDFFS